MSQTAATGGEHGAGASPAPSGSYAFPASFSQERLWILDQLEADGSVYNMPAAVRLRGSLDTAALGNALNTIVGRHEALRTIFSYTDEQLFQVIVPLVELDVSPVAVGAVAEVAVAEARQPFDLAEGPLVRARLLAVAPEEHVLLFTVHHIVSDGWSMGVLVSELAALYEAFCQGRPVPLAELPIQYADYAVWQRDRLAGELLAGQLGYWRDRLGGGPAALELPADRPRPPVQSYAGAAHTITLPAGLAAQVRRFTQEHRASLFMTALTAYTALLSRYTGQDDITVGTFIANRTRPETENLIGFFVNTLVLRTDTSGDPTFAELLGRVRETCLGGYAHQEIPFELLLAELQPERDLSRTPLFQTMLVVQNAPMPPLQLAGLQLDLLPLPSTRSNFDLTIWITEHGDRLEATFDYNTDLFDQPTIARLAGHWQTLLAAGITDPSRHLSALPLLTPAERHQLLTGWNTPATTPDGEATCLHQLFEQQAGTAPEAIAVISGTERLTYRQLNWRANQLAHHLRALGVGPDTPVALCLERSIDALVATLAILKAGGAYLPLDPAYPAHRTGFMLDDAAPPVLITRQVLAARLPTGPHTTICIDTDWPAIATQPTTNPAATIHPANLAYIIYTSGSTGTPKGVLIEHRSIVNYVEFAGQEFRIGPADRVLQFHSLTVDTHAEEIFPALSRGATLVIRPEPMIDSATAFTRGCAELGITVVDLPTGYWHELTAGFDREQVTIPPSVRLVIIAGEKALPERLERWQHHVGERARLANTYGPTEATIVTTLCDLPGSGGLPPRGRELPIGRPVGRVAAYVLDRHQQLLPAGVPGELYAGGAAPARGYLRRPALTAERFLPDPFGPAPGARLYRTGDIVRLRPDGALEFIGRADHQVKIRGFRIEPGEVEVALLRHPGILDAVVVAHDESPTGKRLTAYVVFEPGADQATISELRSFLGHSLPRYMIPATFVTLDQLPKTPGGKIDRDALPLPGSARPRLGMEYVAPRNRAEHALAGMWSDLLGLDQVGVHDDFFELGGHSLLGVRLIFRVRKEFGIELPLFAVFQTPTIAGLAEGITRRVSELRGASVVDADDILQRIDDLPQEEVDLLLKEMLTEKEASDE